MKIEHVAFNVPDAVALAQWYVKNLGLRIVRSNETAPYIHFLADEKGETILEVYSNPLATELDYGSMHPVTFHIAFAVEDMLAERQRLIEAGGVAEGEVNTTATGDQLGFVRDPWGHCIQLVKRATPLI